MPTNPPTASKRGPGRSMKAVRDKIRGTNKQRGYDSQWAQISRMKRQECPVCEVCQSRPATEVDHITPFQGPDDPLRTDWNNLQAICTECHRMKTHGAKNRQSLLFVVCGDPGSGKTTYVQSRAGSSDLVFDLDMIAETLNPGWRFNSDRDVQINALLADWRDVLIRRMKGSKFTHDAWVIVADENKAKSLLFGNQSKLIKCCRQSDGRYTACEILANPKQ